MSLDSLQDLYLEQLRDLYSAENQILEALPKMIERSTHPELRRGLVAHLRQTEEHIERLKQIGERAGKSLTGQRGSAPRSRAGRSGSGAAQDTPGER